MEEPPTVLAWSAKCRAMVVLALLAWCFTAPALHAAADYGATRRGLDQFAQGRFAEAVALWEQAAGAGDATASLYLGVAFDAGQGVPQSDADALRWYKQAAAGGNASAMFNVGVLFDAGHGVPADRAEAARWYAMAAGRGLPRAEYNLGLLYQSGDGVPRDPRRAAALFRAAAGHGLGAARDHLLQLGQRFAGPTRSVQPDTALSEFTRAQGLLLARGTAQAAAAADLFRRAGLQHDPLAAYDYAYCLDSGLGVPQDKVLAYAWYLRAGQDARDDRLRQLAQASAEAIKPRLTASEERAASHALAGLP